MASLFPMNSNLSSEQSDRSESAAPVLENFQNIQQTQEIIYFFFLNLVRQNPPETVLLEFKNFFVLGVSSVDPDAIHALYDIILTQNGDIFRNTFKRVCYIIINNWTSERQYKHIQDLTAVIAEVTAYQSTVSRSLKLLRNWLFDFINSEDYQEIKLLAEYYAPGTQKSWNHRYTSFLLVPQYLDLKNPKEQREIARNLSNQLKEKFQSDLAMYSLHRNAHNAPIEQYANPTNLGNEAIAIVKNLVAQNLSFSYENYSHIFIRQIQDLNYEDFKFSLQRYLTFGLSGARTLDTLNTKLAPKINALYVDRNAEHLNFDLFLRTCRRIIEFLTTEDAQQPSTLFVLMTDRESTLSLAIVLLKIILICKYVRIHLEVCIAKLIRYYEKFSEQECHWFINFLEVFNVVFSIYTENVQYHLVRIKDSESGNSPKINLDAYRVFPQLKGTDLRGTNLSNTDLRGQNLSAADLREANLSGADLSEANLSLVRLNQANAIGTILHRADLVAANLRGANLQGANLRETHLRYADLRNAHLNSADFSLAKLKMVDLSQADLSHAELKQADLSRANLTEANLTGASFSRANLTGANLAGANLTGANLGHANLTGVNLTGANLADANLSYADLTAANLTGANLNRAFLRRTILTEAILRDADLSNAEFSYANLRDADLSQANLSNCCLRHVKIAGANFNSARLLETNLFKTKLQRANVKDARFKDNFGLSSTQKLELEQQGAIFE
jgi:uncharacterized protein YjbI with pentapeptide repeats